MKIECTPEELLELIKKEPQRIEAHEVDKFIQSVQKAFANSLKTNVCVNDDGERWGNGREKRKS